MNHLLITLTIIATCALLWFYGGVREHFFPVCSDCGYLYSNHGNSLEIE